MKLLIMLVPMLMIGCDGSRESFTIAFDADRNSCNFIGAVSYAIEETSDCSCPSGFARVGFTNTSGSGREYFEVVCLQD